MNPKHRSSSVRASRPASASSPGRRHVSPDPNARLRTALDEVPRSLFVPADAARDSVDEQPVSLGSGRTIPSVPTIATMLGAVELDGSERVLDVGTGSGYQAALLSRLAREVISIELDPELARAAALRLEQGGFRNVRVVQGDGAQGWPEHAPYQAIVAGVAVPELPPALIDQLELGGRLVIALGDADSQLIERFHKRLGGLESETIGASHLDILSDSRRTPSSFPWAAGPKMSRSPSGR